MEFGGANNCLPKGRERLVGSSNFFIGNDASKWISSANHFREVLYPNLYRDIDLRFYLTLNKVKYDVIIHPGGDPAEVRFFYSGIDSLLIDPRTGNLLINTPIGSVTEDAPVAYQGSKVGRDEVPVRFRLANERTVAFSVGRFDAEQDLVIDPGLYFSTFIGDISMEHGRNVCVDKEGNVYIVGQTSSMFFPISDETFDDTFSGQSDAFVVKLNENGTSIIYSTFIGGIGEESVWDIEVDDSLRATIVGGTTSPDFPITNGSAGTTFDGITSAYILRLSSNGTQLDYSCIFSGSIRAGANRLFLDTDGNVYVAGATSSSDFPTTDGAYCRTISGSYDIFVLKLNPTGDQILFSTIIGGSSFETSRGIVVDGNGAIYVCGVTESRDFPTTTGAYDTTPNGTSDAIVFKLSKDGSRIEYSSYFGGSNREECAGIGLLNDDEVVISGETGSSDLEMSDMAYDNSYNGNGDCYIAQFNSKGDALIYSTYLGGISSEVPYSIRMDTGGGIYLTGSVRGAGLPVTDGTHDRTPNGEDDVFVMKFNIIDNELLYSTYLGGGDYDIGYGIDFDAKGGAYITGSTFSGDFPVVTGSFDTTFNRNQDAFALAISDLDPPMVAKDNTPGNTTTGEVLEFNVTIVDARGVVNMTVEYWFGDINITGIENMSLSSGTRQLGNWTFGLQVPSGTAGPLYYRFVADDAGGNVRRSEPANVTVVDNDPPGLLDDSGWVATTGDPFTLTVTVLDNLGVAAVLLEYWYVDGGSTNVSMVEDEPFNGSAAGFSYTIPSIRSNSIDPLRYRITVMDPSGNTFVTPVSTVQVNDNDIPSLRGYDHADTFTTGDEFVLEVNFSDNVGVAFVWVHYRLGDSEEYIEPMTHADVNPTGNGTYHHRLLVPSDLSTNVSFFYRARDTSMNYRSTMTFIVPVVDNDAPRIIADDTPGTALKGLDLTFSAVIEDNTNLAGAYLVFTFEGASEQNVSLGLVPPMNHTVHVPRDAQGDLTYHFVMYDGEGNANITPPRTIFLENSPPSIHSIPKWEVTEDVEEKLDLTTYLEDLNDPLGSLEVECLHPNVSVEGMELVAFFDRWVPDLSIEISVTDGEDATTSTLDITISEVNDAPRFPDDLPGEVHALEDSLFELDLSATDEEGDPITWTDDTPLFSIDAETGTTSFTPAQADVGSHQVSISVSDGKGGTGHYTFVLVVENVNDEPAIVSVTPENGSRFKEGKVVTFSVQATDEDGDELTVTWTSDGKTLGTGETLDYKKLKPGTRVVKVTVSDGNATAEDEISLVIKKSDKSPGPGFVLAALALMGIALAISIRRRRNTHYR